MSFLARENGGATPSRSRIVQPPGGASNISFGDSRDDRFDREPRTPYVPSLLEKRDPQRRQRESEQVHSHQRRDDKDITSGHASTRVAQAPGGNSSLGNLIYRGYNEDKATPQRHNNYREETPSRGRQGGRDDNGEVFFETLLIRPVCLSFGS
jgi:hypothetical protein